jgi:effector-binding domain-containing protein
VAYEVIIERTTECPTAVVKANTTWRTFPTVRPAMLDEVWAFLGATAGLPTVGHNVMLHRNDLPEVAVEVGVQVIESFEALSRIVASTLPAAETAATVHTGTPAEIGAAHDAVRAWCSAQRRELTGVAWEIHGDPDPQTGHFDVVVYWQLAESGGGDQRRRQRVQQLHGRTAGSPTSRRMRQQRCGMRQLARLAHHPGTWLTQYWVRRQKAIPDNRAQGSRKPARHVRYRGRRRGVSGHLIAPVAHARRSEIAQPLPD